MLRLYGWLESLLRRCDPLFRRVGYARIEPIFSFLERNTKGWLFNCDMCGHCLLSQNGMVCPMRCPKQVRNGPCGGVSEDGRCEVDERIFCLWVKGWQAGLSVPDDALNSQLNPPAEHNRSGSSAWVRLLTSAPASDPPKEPPVASNSALQQLLRNGAFVVTSELSPPDSADPASVLEKLDHFRGNVDGLNVTDSPSGNCHMSSLAVSTILTRHGCEPILQMACRDRNRIAMQAEILGAAALGVKNVLCLTGDHVEGGDDPGAKPVFDLDSLGLLETIRHMRDHSEFRSGRTINSPPALFLGAAANPFAPPFELRPLRLARKIAAGAQFIQTQFCFDLPLLEDYMQRVRDLGLHERCKLLIGVGPVASARNAKWLRKNIPGVHIPDFIIDRLEGAADQHLEGRNICIEMMQRIVEIDGVAGVHLMAPRQEHQIPEIVAASGVLNGRTPTGAGVIPTKKD